MRASLLAALFIVTGAGAAQAPHRERAQQAETLGQMGRAAAEYEAAWSEERAPELLYRLGIVRRRLREYGKAKQAFRGYLRALPDGPLGDEVERQIAQLNILIEGQAQDAPVRPKRAHTGSIAGPDAAGGSPRGEVTPAPGSSGGAPAQVPPPIAASRSREVQRAGGQAPATAREEARPQASKGAATPEAASSLPQSAMPERTGESPARSADGAPAVAPVDRNAAEVRRPAPVAAVAGASPMAAHEQRRAGPWLLAGALVAGAGGALLWWDGDRVARDLDGRFAAGDLTAADRGRYSRSRGEGIAGRALAAAALGLAGATVFLW